MTEETARSRHYVHEVLKLSKVKTAFAEAVRVTEYLECPGIVGSEGLSGREECDEYILPKKECEGRMSHTCRHTLVDGYQALAKSPPLSFQSPVDLSVRL